MYTKIYYRFPLKNKPILQCWERFVQQANSLKEPWKATSFSRICSNHFKMEDYILPPSITKTCRLKKYAIPSELDCDTTILEESQCSRLKNPHKRPLPPTELENLSPPVKMTKTAEEERNELEKKLRQKIRNLQQKLRRSKQKVESMSEVIKVLQDKLVINSSEAEALHSEFDNIHLQFLHNFKDNHKASPSGRRYSDEIKEFAITLHYYSPKAYEYIRSIVPLPNKSLIRKWSATFACEPGFIEEAFNSLSTKITTTPSDKDSCLVIDGMSIRKQTLWNAQKDQYSGFVDLGGVIPNAKPDTLASEALVFLLVGSRSHWKCPIGYFLINKITAEEQAALVLKSLEKAHKAGLKVWSVTADGTSVNVRMFELLGCNFNGTYDDIKTSFAHPTSGENVFVILDPCHMLKLARNALGFFKSFSDSDGNQINWHFIEQLQKLQEQEGLNLGNKLSSNHLKYEKHKMNVSLAAQTLSASVANAIEFLDKSVHLPGFNSSHGTVKFIRTIDQIFDMLNSRNPIAKGFKTPLRLQSKDTWTEIFLTAAEYLMSLKTNTTPAQPLHTTQRKTFIIGFVTCIKSTIAMTTQMFAAHSNPFKYLLTYKFNQDHIELLFSCIRSRGGWNNNPNCLQFKYALRKMLMQNAITASKSSNCRDFTGYNNIVPLFHTAKHKTPPSGNQSTNAYDETELNFISEHLDDERHSEFMSNVLFYIAGYIVSKLLDNLTCPGCKKSLVPQANEAPHNGHDYTATLYHDAGKASSFTNFVNNGGLHIPSTSVYRTVEYCEHLFKAKVTGKDGHQITSERNLKKKMIVNVCHHFALETTMPLFADHEEGENEIVVEDDHRTKLIKFVADKYFTLRLFNFGKKYTKEIIYEGKQSDRHHLNKVILFRNQ